jgi:hypothetical protein
VTLRSSRNTEGFIFSARAARFQFITVQLQNAVSTMALTLP